MDDKLTRKDRERQARSDLFLNIARDVIEKDGYHELSMNRIAEVAEYSKGTIYLHYASREMVLMALCQRGFQAWQDLAKSVLESDLDALDKLFGLSIAHHIYAQLYPVEYDALFLVQASSIREKISDDAHAELTTSIGSLVQAFNDVIKEAIEAGTITLPSDMTAAQLADGLWRLLVRPYAGGQATSVSGAAVQDTGHPGDPALILRTILTGLGGADIAEGAAFAERLTRVRDRLFSDQMAAVRAKSQA
ncbi:MAG: TetR/AcrR family transcriptional regulator [Pseudomonadota bacterium]